MAYATFLGSRSTTLVGGVELGSQFIQVKVEKPIGEDEDLIRKRENCRTIRDAFASGLTIAWPSACVCTYLPFLNSDKLNFGYV